MGRAQSILNMLERMGYDIPDDYYTVDHDFLHNLQSALKKNFKSYKGVKVTDIKVYPLHKGDDSKWVIDVELENDNLPEAANIEFEGSLIRVLLIPELVKAAKGALKNMKRVGKTGEYEVWVGEVK